MAKNIVYITVGSLALAFAVTIAIFYMGSIFGTLVFFLWPASITLVILIARSRWRGSEERGPISVFVALFYAASLVLAWAACFDHVSQEVHLMSWEDKGPDKENGETEIVLHYVEFPNHYIGIFSSELAGYLSDATSPILVTFEVTSDLGCMRGYNEVQIGELKSWSSRWGYGGRSGTSKGPWEGSWWCP